MPEYFPTDPKAVANILNTAVTLNLSDLSYVVDTLQKMMEDEVRKAQEGLEPA